jgi:8-oxo-dGTP pyrophosphatase MutT (NUDIX family)
MIDFANKKIMYEQSAIIPYRIRDGNFEILIITTRSSKKWTIPKGLIEDNLTPEESAEQEGYEEAGIKGIINPRIIGEYQYQKWGGICSVKVYPLEITQIMADWPESYFRKRKWIRLDEVQNYIPIAELQKTILRLPRFLANKD